jgi:hypothetical protein
MQYVYKSKQFVYNRVHMEKKNIEVLHESLKENNTSMHHIHPTLVHGESLIAHGVHGPW